MPSATPRARATRQASACRAAVAGAIPRRADRRNAYAQPALRRRGAARAAPPPIAPAFTRGERGSHSRDRVHREHACFRRDGRRTPRRSGGVSAMVAPARNRSVSESTRAAPRVTRVHDANDRVGRAAAPPADRLARAHDPLVGDRRARVGALGREPVEDTAPEGGERVRRRRRRGTASARSPDAATITTRRGSSVADDDRRRARSPRPARASSAVQAPFGECAAPTATAAGCPTQARRARAQAATAARRRRTTRPRSAAGTISASGPRVAARGGPNAAVSP